MFLEQRFQKVLILSLISTFLIVFIGAAKPVQANFAESGLPLADALTNQADDRTDAFDQPDRYHTLRDLAQQEDLKEIRALHKQSKREAVFLEQFGSTLAEADPTSQLSPEAFTSCAAVSDVPLAECEALVALYNNNGGTSWTNKSGWLASEQVCTWYGITCDSGNVAMIELPANNLTGTLGVDFSGLTGLTYFDLEQNQLSGNMTTVIGNLPTTLEFLYLGGNGFNDKIPTSISGFTNLTVLSVEDNALSGSMVTVFTNLPTSLEELWLNDNAFSVTIPSDVADLTSLSVLEVSGNALTGNLSSTIIKDLPTSLTYLGLARNQFTGGIPGDIADLTALRYLNVGHNQIAGDLATVLGNLNVGLEHLNVENNSFTGTIPAGIASFTSLLELSLGGNQLDGSLTTITDNLPASLTTLSLYSNSFTGTIPASMADLTGLVTLDLADNQLEGSLTIIIGYLPTSIQNLILNHNDFDGTIPAQIANFSSLSILDAGYNFLTGNMNTIIGYLPTSLTSLFLDWNNLPGSIPADIADLTSLVSLDLGGNVLTGDLSTIIGYLPTSLIYLRLDWNDFSGTIPSQIANFTSLVDLDLGGNALTGDLSTIIGDLPSGMDFLRLDNNDFSGTIPADIADLTQLTRLDVSNNSLTGSLTTIIGTLPTGLYALYLDGNDFTGTIPASISSFTSLWTLDVSHNDNLTGDLGTIIGNMPAGLSTLDLGANNFTGNIPSTISNIANLTHLDISLNSGLTGLIPMEITSLSLVEFNFGGTYLCEPDDPAYDTWKASVTDYTAGLCNATSVNILTNTSFETFIPVGWQDGRQIDPDDGPDCEPGITPAGNCAVHFEGDGSSKRIFMRYKLAGVAGDEFDLSIWRKGASIPAADGAYVKATLFYKDGTQESFKLNLDKGNWNNWEQFSLAFTATKDYKRVNLDLFYKKASGTMWLDEISLKRNGGAELLENTSFEIYKPDDWILAKELDANEGPDCSGSNAHSGNCSTHFDGDGSNKRLLRRAKKAGSAGDLITIGIWRKGASVPAAGGAYVKVEIFYTDGTSDIIRMDLDTGNLSVWEEFNTDFTAAKDYKRFNIDLFYKKNSGTMWLDDISLMVP